MLRRTLFLALVVIVLVWLAGGLPNLTGQASFGGIGGFSGLNCGECDHTDPDHEDCIPWGPCAFDPELNAFVEKRHVGGCTANDCCYEFEEIETRSCGDGVSSSSLSSAVSTSSSSDASLPALSSASASSVSSGSGSSASAGPSCTTTTECNACPEGALEAFLLASDGFVADECTEEECALFNGTLELEYESGCVWTTKERRSLCTAHPNGGIGRPAWTLRYTGTPPLMRWELTTDAGNLYILRGFQEFNCKGRNLFQDDTEESKCGGGGGVFQVDPPAGCGSGGVSASGGSSTFSGAPVAELPGSSASKAASQASSLQEPGPVLGPEAPSSPFAAVYQSCGDGLVQGTEECDDANDQNDDECLSNCSKPRCGDGIVSGGEECDEDDGNSPTGACKPNCQKYFCGNRVQEGGEECDDGNDDNADGCTDRCKMPNCGDGLRQTFEQCDDGNRENGDGCSDTCLNEVRAAAPQSPAINASSAASTATLPSQVTEPPSGPPVPPAITPTTPPASAAPSSTAPFVPGTLPATVLQPPTVQQPRGPVGATGPAAVLIIVTGAAGGFAWMRRRSRK